MSDEVISKGPASAGPGAGEQATTSWPDRALFVVGAVGLVTSVLWFSLCSPGRPWEMAVAAGAALALMLVGRLHLFDLIKAGGLEFHVHRARRAAAQAEAATQKAYATLNEVREFARVVGALSSDVLMLAGVHAGYPTRNKMKHQKQLTGALRSLGISQTEVAEVTASVRWFIGYRHAQHVVDAVQQLAARSDPPGKGGNAIAPLQALSNFEDRVVAPAGVYRSMLATYGAPSTGIEEALLDYEHFEREGTFRRPEFWNVYN